MGVGLIPPDIFGRFINVIEIGCVNTRSNRTSEEGKLSSTGVEEAGRPAVEQIDKALFLQIFLERSKTNLVNICMTHSHTEVCGWSKYSTTYLEREIDLEPKVY